MLREGKTNINQSNQNRLYEEISRTLLEFCQESKRFNRICQELAKRLRYDSKSENVTQLIFMVPIDDSPVLYLTSELIAQKIREEYNLNFHNMTDIGGLDYLMIQKGAVRTVSLREILPNDGMSYPEYIQNAEFIVLAQQNNPPGISEEIFPAPPDLSDTVKEPTLSDIGRNKEISNRLYGSSGDRYTREWFKQQL